MTVFDSPPGRVHNAGGQRGWSLWRSHTGRMNNEHTLFSHWAGSAQQTMSPSLLSSTMSDNDHIQQHPRSPSLMTYMSIKCDKHDELQEVRRGYDVDYFASACCVRQKPHVACFAAPASLYPQRRKWFFAFCMLCCKNIPLTSTDLLQNKKKIEFCFFFCFFCCRNLPPCFPPASASGRYSGFPCLSIRSEYKYELRLALLSDEWSCQPNSASFQSRVLPLIPHSRTAGSCENWKWQSNQHVEQADWTKLSWPRSELFNTSARQRVPLSEHPASLCAF